jgi:hypothetical protein
VYAVLPADRPPFPGGTLPEKLVKHQLDEPEPVEALRPDVPAWLAAVVRRLMAKSPDNRFPTAASTAAALAAGPADAPAEAEGGGTPHWSELPPTRAADRGRRRRWLAVGGALGLLLAAVALVALWHGSRKEPPPEGPSPRLSAEVLLDRLDRDAIPAEELAAAGDGDPARAPAGLVAVLGDHLLKHWGPVNYVAFRPAGTPLLASGGQGGVVRLWDPATGRHVRLLPSPDGEVVVALAFSPDGRRIATRGFDGRLLLWDAATGRALAAAAHPQPVTGLAFSDDGRLLAAGADNHRVRLYDPQTAQPAREIRLNRPYLQELAFLPGGRSLLTLADRIQRWSVESGEEEESLPAPKVTPPEYSQMAVAGAGKWAAADTYGTVLLWDLSRQDRPRVLAHQAYAVAFNPRAGTFATGDGSGEVRVWRAEDGQVLRTLAGHRDPVTSLAFSPDGRRLASAAADGTLRICDLSAGRIPGPRPRLTSCRLTGPF